jgi:pyruvate dehydrogenase E2 component (dihydrolipoamide acetyltransferase)
MADDFEFKLPDVGEGVHEGEIVEWHVDEGDHVEADEDIVDVMTDKATVQISAPVAGTIEDLVYDEGDVVDVGEVFVIIAPEDGAEADTADEPEPEPEAAESEGDGDEEKTLFELPEKQTSAGGTRPARRERSAAPRQGQVLAMPRVRHEAKQEGVDLATVEPTGSKGHVTMEDLEEAIKRGEPGFGPQAMDFDLPEVDRSGAREVEELKGLRKRIWESMSRAKTLQPHFTYVEQVRADKLVQVREELKELGEERGVKVTYLPLITKAVVRALRNHPRCNALVDEETRDLVVKEPVNMGVAAATDRGLTVPVVHDAHEKSILEIAADVNELGQKANEQKLTMEDLTGGTFTITSLGRVGGLMATPIINHPQVAIMGVHAIRDVPVVEDGEVVPGKVMNLSFSFDHRLVDGYDGALFAQDVKRFLEDPNLLLLESR